MAALAAGRIPLALLAALAADRTPLALSAELAADRILQDPLAELAADRILQDPLAESAADATALGCCDSRHGERGGTSLAEARPFSWRRSSRSRARMLTGLVKELRAKGVAIYVAAVHATQPMIFSADETTDVGSDGATPVSSDYGQKDNKFNQSPTTNHFQESSREFNK